MQQIRPVAFLALGPNEDGKVSIDIQSGPGLKLVKPHIQQAWDEGCAAFVKAFNARMLSNIYRVDTKGDGQYSVTDEVVNTIVTDDTLIVEELANTKERT